MSAPPITVCLVHPPPYGEVPFKSLGLCSVAAGLRRAGLGTVYLDASERFHRAGEDFYDDLVLRLSRHAGDMTDLPRLGLLGEVLFPDEGDSDLAATIRAQADSVDAELGDAEVVGLHVNTLTAYFAARLGRLLRGRGVRVLVGGPSASIPAVSHLLLRLGAADAVLAGEGDLSAAPLARALAEGRSPSGVAGAIWLEGGAVASTPPGPPPRLAELPRPELEGSLLDDFLPIAASRGCSRRCIYCSETGLWRGFQQREPTEVVAEMEERAAETSIRDFHFHDDLLNCSRRSFARLVAALDGRGLTWESFFEPYGLDQELVEAMARAGCRLVKYGVQSFSADLLRSMGRPPRVEAVTEVIRRTYEAGISTHFDMLVGHPGETDEDHRRSLRAIEGLYESTGDRLYFSLNPYYVAAGSAIWRDPAGHGVELVERDRAGLPRPLAEAVAAGPPYPEGYRSDVPREATMRRMAELAEVLRRHGKDYLYLGQDHLPAAGRRGRRMLRPREATLVEAALARGARRAALPALTLGGKSNLKTWPAAGPARPLPEGLSEIASLEAALARLAAAPTLRIVGGEPTLAAALPRALAVARGLDLPCLVETNGLRLAAAPYLEALVRAGLERATVLLLGCTAAVAEALGGVPGCLDLALEGARALAASGVETSLGLAVSEASVDEIPRLPALAAAGLPSASEVVVLVAPLEGRDPPPLPDQDALDRVLDRAALEADRLGLALSVERRTDRPADE